MSAAMKVLMLMAGQLRDKEKRNKLLIIILIPVGVVLFFFSIFAFKSSDPRDVYLQAAEEVAAELETVNRLDGNLAKSIYFLYKGKETEDKEEIKAFIETFFVKEVKENIWIPAGGEGGEGAGSENGDGPFITITPAGPDDSPEELPPGEGEGEYVEVTYFAFKTYMEIQAMLLLPPFSFSAPEMLLVNLYLLTPAPEGTGEDVGFGDGQPDSGGQGGNVPGGDLPDGGDTGGGSRPDLLPFRLPSPCAGSVTSYYGVRTHPVTGEALSFHTGIDIQGTHHQAIHSVAEGTVVSASTEKNGYGNYVKIRHEVDGQVFYSFYAHLSRLNVKAGQTVAQGQTIAWEGGDPKSDPNPGTSTGHHLHFEIRLGLSRDSCIDPGPYIGK